MLTFHDALERSIVKKEMAVVKFAALEDIFEESEEAWNSSKNGYVATAKLVLRTGRKVTEESISRKTGSSRRKESI